MENTLTQITNYLATQSWQIAVLAAAIAAVSLLLKNKSAHVRYLLWLIVLAKCLTPPLLTIPLAVLPQEPVPQPAAVVPAEIPALTIEPVRPVVYERPAALGPAPPVIERASLGQRLSGFAARQWLPLTWISGFALFFLITLIKALRTNVWLQRARRPLPAGLQESIDKLFSELGIRRPPKLWLVKDIGQPFVWGLLRGGIYLPADFARLDSPKHRRGILGHELSHVLRFDAAVNLLQIIIQAVFWFHPFVWWANKKIRAEREKCCDEMAIARLNAEAKDYGTAIVNTLIAEHRAAKPIPSLAVAGPVKNIEDRIKTILSPDKKFYKRPTFLVVITILLLALIAVPTTLALTSRPPKKTDVQVEGDEKQFKAVLPNGVTVELVGVCEYPNGPIWSPEGTKLERKLMLQEHADLRRPNTLGFVVKLNTSDFDLRYEIEGVSSYSVVEVYDDTGQELHNHSAAVAQVDSDSTATAVRLWVTSGPWETIAECDGDGEFVRGADIVFSPPIESKRGTAISVSGDWDFDGRRRIVAVEKDGDIHEGGWSGHSSWSKKTIATTQFPDIMPDLIQKYQLQFRPYELVTFKNVSLKPGLKTDAQVEMDYSSVTVEEGVGFADIVVGDSNCTSEFIKSKLGEPDKEVEYKKLGLVLNYNKKYGLEFRVNPKENILKEIRLNNGRFKGKLTSGISASSTKEDVFAVYGQPREQIRAQDFENRFDDEVLLMKWGPVGQFSKIYYNKHGLCFWFGGDKVLQIVIYNKKVKTDVQVEVEPIKKADVQVEVEETSKAGGGMIDLLQRYPTALTEADTEPANAREWKFSAEDIYHLSRFSLDIAGELKIEIEQADVGIGHCVDGAVWAVVVPKQRGVLNSSANEDPEEIKHLWLRFHPAEVQSLFRKQTVTRSGDKNLLTLMQKIADIKLRGSWHSGTRVMIPGRKDFTVDADTQKGIRRFFVVDREANTARYISAFENIVVPDRWAKDGSAPVYIIKFQPIGSFTPRTAKELLDAFNSQVRFRVTTHHFRTAVEDNKLVGYILTDSRAQQKAIKSMFDKSDKLEFVSAKAATEAQLAEHYAMGQPGLNTDVQTEVEKRRARFRAEFKKRTARDRATYSDRELSEIERLYQIANKKWKSKEARDSLEKLVARYAKANRTGCAVLYLGQMSDGTQKQRYLKRAIEDFGDCMYGDGVQVGAYARYLLAMHYRQTNRKNEAKELVTELINLYPDAINHNGELLIEQIPDDLKVAADSHSKRQAKKKERVSQNPIGKWRSVDFVQKIEDFKPGVKSWQGELFFKDVEFNKGGKTSTFFTWRSGWIRHEDGRTRSRYKIKKINGSTYLFLPWLSGDVTIKGEKPWYYVMEKVGDQTARAAPERKPTNKAVYEQLEKIFDLSELSAEMHFADALDVIKNSVDPPLNVFVFWNDLHKEADVDKTSPIHINSDAKVPLKMAFNLLLDSVSGGFGDLTYTVANGLIYIGPKQSLRKKVKTSSHHISDVVGAASNLDNISGLVQL